MEKIAQLVHPFKCIVDIYFIVKLLGKVMLPDIVHYFQRTAYSKIVNLVPYLGQHYKSESLMPEAT